MQNKSMESKQNILIRCFYRGDDWKIARAMKIAAVGGRCDKCGAVGIKVHHIIHLTPENVTDPSISLNQDNLLLLFNECHNKEHGRLEGSSNYGFDAEGNLFERKNRNVKTTTR